MRRPTRERPASCEPRRDRTTGVATAEDALEFVLLELSDELHSFAAVEIGLALRKSMIDEHCMLASESRRSRANEVADASPEPRRRVPLA